MLKMLARQPIIPESNRLVSGFRLTIEYDKVIVGIGEFLWNGEVKSFGGSYHRVTNNGDVCIGADGEIRLGNIGIPLFRIDGKNIIPLFEELAYTDDEPDYQYLEENIVTEIDGALMSFVPVSSLFETAQVVRVSIYRNGIMNAQAAEERLVLSNLGIPQPGEYRILVTNGVPVELLLGSAPAIGDVIRLSYRRTRPSLGNRIAAIEAALGASAF